MNAKLWTPEEVKTLRKNYGALGVFGCAILLPRWSTKSIRFKVQKEKLKLDKDNFDYARNRKTAGNEKQNAYKRSLAEAQNRRYGAKKTIVDATIRRTHKNKTAGEIAALLGVKKGYVQNRSQSLGIKLLNPADKGRRIIKSTRAIMEDTLGEIGRLALYQSWSQRNRQFTEKTPSDPIPRLRRPV